MTGSPAAPAPEIEPRPAADRSSGRRRPLALGGAVVAVAALGVAAFVALTGGVSDGVDIAEPYSLQAAAETAVIARTVEFDLAVSASDLVDVTVTGVVDTQSQIMSVTADLSSLLAVGEPSDTSEMSVPFMPFVGGEMTALVDGSTGVIYLDAAAFGGLISGDTAWVSLDLRSLAEQNGQAFDDLQAELALDPTDIARSLLDTDSVTEIGVETIDAVEVKHYEVSVDLAAALASVPQADNDTGLPDTVTYDVWVTADNQLRRVTFDTEIAGQSIGMVLDMTTSDEPLDVELPDDADVVDLTALLGF